MRRIIHGPFGAPRLGSLLSENLERGEWTRFTAAVAFVKSSGVRHIRAALSAFGDRGGVTRIAVGVDAQGTSREGLADLSTSVRGDAEIVIVHNQAGSSFHPKIYLFENAHRAQFVLGSGNLTGGGLYTNYELGLHVSLERARPDDADFLAQLTTLLNEWTTPDERIIRALTPSLLTELHEQGYVLAENDLAHRQRELAATRHPRAAAGVTLFASIPVPAAPPRAFVREAAPQRFAPRPATITANTPRLDTEAAALRGFVMTLQQTDMGVGQTTAGTSRRSPEIFVPLAARDFAPAFWGWPDEFVADPRRPSKVDRKAVRMRLGADIIDVNMMTWPAKHDFRLRSARIRAAGDVGDILRLERSDGTAAFRYYVEIIPQGTAMFDAFRRLCTHTVRNSTKRWGYYD
jgi:HKD family nuclease